MLTFAVEDCFIDCILDFRCVVFARLEPFQICQNSIFLGLVRCAIIPTSATAAVIIATAGQTLIRIANRPQSIFALRGLDFDKRPIVAIDFRCVGIKAYIVDVPRETKICCYYCIRVSGIFAKFTPLVPCKSFVYCGSIIKNVVAAFIKNLAHNSVI